MSADGRKNGSQLTLIGDLLKPMVKQMKAKERAAKGPTAVQQRLIDAAAAQMDGDEQALLYQHTVLCQTCLPYRDPGAEVRRWERSNGTVALEVEAGRAMHPEKGKFVDVGLPFGPKSRLVLMHINQRAIVTGSPIIEVSDSLTSFVSRILGLADHGRNIRVVKEQLARLAASSIRLGIVRDGHALTVNTQIVTAFDIWFPKDDSQRVLWPSTIQLAHEYHQSLLQHAVPLDDLHIAALSHSGLALDIYAWLAQRLHRIPVGKPARISWIALHNQFGQGYNPERINNFRAAFRVAMKEVLTVYRTARIEDAPARRPAVYVEAGKRVWREPPAPGLLLHHSPPPVRKLIK